MNQVAARSLLQPHMFVVTMEKRCVLFVPARVRSVGVELATKTGAGKAF